MDILEGLFQKAWNKLGINPPVIRHHYIQDNEERLRCLWMYLCPEERCHFKPSRRFVGLSGQTIYLPQEYVRQNKNISYYQENQKYFAEMCYIVLTLQIAAIKIIKLKVKTAYSIDRRQHRLEVLKQFWKINNFLDEVFPKYNQWQNAVVENYLIHFDKKNILKLKEIYLARREIYCDNTVGFFNDFIISENISLYIPCISDDFDGNQDRKTNRQAHQNLKQKKIEKEILDKPELVQLNDKEVNPIAHSFEKIESCDEYKGGRKMDSGDDEIDDHAQALDEVHLSQLTRDGSTAVAAFTTDSVDMSWKNQMDRVEPSRDQEIFYPEWNSRKNKYLENFCHVVTGYVDVSENINSSLVEKIQIKYAQQIKLIRAKVESLFNEPLWQKNRIDGSEIDIDKYIHHRSHMMKDGNASEKWFMDKIKSESDLSMIVLFDQSMSSDSWIKDQRVIDVTTDFVCLLGLTLSELIPQVQIAGVWSETRHYCSYQIYKDFSQDWNQFYMNAHRIEPTGYTRLGPSIRHAIAQLKNNSSRQRMILLITDGKPTDADGYEGQYGIDDMKKAVQEAEKMGIFTYAIAIDRVNKNYFNHMFNEHSCLSSSEQFFDEIWKILKLCFKAKM